MNNNSEEIPQVDVFINGGSGYGKTTYLSTAFNALNGALNVVQKRVILKDLNKKITFAPSKGPSEGDIKTLMQIACDRYNGVQEMGSGKITDTPRTETVYDYLVTIIYDTVELFKIKFIDYNGGFDDLNNIKGAAKGTKYRMAFMPAPALKKTPEPWADNADVKKFGDVAKMMGQVFRSVQEADAEPGYYFVNLTCSDKITPLERSEIVKQLLEYLMRDDQVKSNSHVPLELNFTACPANQEAKIDVQTPMIVLLACILKDLEKEMKKGLRILSKRERLIIQLHKVLQEKLQCEYDFSLRKFYSYYGLVKVNQINIDDL